MSDPVLSNAIRELTACLSKRCTICKAFGHNAELAPPSPHFIGDWPEPMTWVCPVVQKQIKEHRGED